MKLILDSGALVALERNERAMWRRLKSALAAGEIPITHGGVIGQVWRARGARQALLSKALHGVEVRAIDDKLGREAGALLARTGGRDVIDAAVVLLCEDGDVVVTSDVKDLSLLAKAAGRDLELWRA